MANNPLQDRFWKVIYGALTIGGTASGTNYHLLDKFDLQLGYTQGSLAFDVGVTGDSDAEFTARCIALEAAYRLPRQRLRVLLGTETQLDYDPATYSGFNQDPSASRLDTDEATARSARYRVTVRWDLPSSAQAGRTLTTRIRRTQAANGIRSVEISGAYTAISSITASATYAALVDTYTASVLSGIDGSVSWGLVSKQSTPNDNNTLCDFTHNYEEIHYAESTASQDDTDIFNQRLTVDVDYEAVPEGVYLEGDMPVVVTATYSADVLKSASLATKWDTVIYPHIRATMGQAVNYVPLTYMSARPSFDFTSHSISANVVARGYSGLNIITDNYECSDHVDEGLRLVKLADGSDYNYIKYPGVRKWVRTERRHQLRKASRGTVSVTRGQGLALGISTGTDSSAPGEESVLGLKPAKGFEKLTFYRTRRNFYIGFRGMSPVQLEDVTEILASQRAELKNKK